MLVDAARATITTPLPIPPPQAGQSHVEILDSNRACESAAGFQSCAHDPISIPMLRPFAENWPHAIALPTRGEGADRVRGPDLHNDEVIAACSPQLERGQSREREHDRD